MVGGLEPSKFTLHSFCSRDWGDRGVNFWWGIYQHPANVQELISKHGKHSCHCELHVILVFRIGIEMMFAYC